MPSPCSRSRPQRSKARSAGDRDRDLAALGEALDAEQPGLVPGRDEAAREPAALGRRRVAALVPDRELRGPRREMQRLAQRRVDPKERPRVGTAADVRGGDRAAAGVDAKGRAERDQGRGLAAVHRAAAAVGPRQSARDRSERGVVTDRPARRAVGCGRRVADAHPAAAAPSGSAQ